MKNENEKLLKAIQDIDFLMRQKVCQLKNTARDIRLAPNDYTIGEMLRAENEYKGARDLHFLLVDYAERVLGFSESQIWAKTTEKKNG